jgi:hypothetical protein
LFPEQFTLTLDGDRKVEIDREKLNSSGLATEGRWLKPAVTTYIRIPSFSDFQFETNALEFVRRFQNAKTLILDVRNNAGGILPRQLIRALMNRPYDEWKMATLARFLVVDSDPDDEKRRNSTKQAISENDGHATAMVDITAFPIHASETDFTGNLKLTRAGCSVGLSDLTIRVTEGAAIVCEVERGLVKVGAVEQVIAFHANL